MSQISQRAVVFQFVCAVLGLDPSKKIEQAVKPTKEQRKQIVDLVTEACYAGKVQFKDSPKNKQKLSDKAEMRKYCDGLVNNWIRQDKALNGGVDYVAKNPGSRAGQGDDQLRELKKCHELLIAKNAPAENIAMVAKRIADRTSELATKKAEAMKVDLSKLPDDIRALLEPKTEVSDEEQELQDAQAETMDGVEMTDEELEAATAPEGETVLETGDEQN